VALSGTDQAELIAAELYEMLTRAGGCSSSNWCATRPALHPRTFTNSYVFRATASCGAR